MEEWSVHNFEILTLSSDEAEARTRALARLILKAALKKSGMPEETGLRRAGGRASMRAHHGERSR